MANFVILGAGAFAREVYWHIQGTYGQEAQILFADDHSDIREIRFGDAPAIPVIKDWKFPESFVARDRFRGFVVGAGSARAKKGLSSAALASGLFPAETVVHPRALVQGRDCKIGKGGVITPGCVLTTNVTLGDYVVLNLNCTVGHDTHIGDFVTCNPGCNISGGVWIQSGCLIGTGTVIRENTSIE